MKTVNINLAERSYDILIGGGLLGQAGKYFNNIFGAKRPKVFIVTDENVANLYLKPLEKTLFSEGYKVVSIKLSAGEATKSFANLERVTNEVLAHQPERSSCLVALGGGVIGDLAGFAASIILRGMNFIQIPTSLLAMVDSSVGGKTAVNSPAGKNLVGSFYQPKLVLADLDVLKTLPKRELQAGYAEIVKYGLIDDVEFFNYLETQNGYDELSYMVEHSCEAKAKVVIADEKEAGARALLNLGHTFGHALEAKFHFDGRLLHGEGVAIGMILAFEFSEYLGICEKGRAARIEKLFEKYGLRTQIAQLQEKFNVDELVKYMYQDKKVMDGKLTFILANDIGKSFIKKDVDEAVLRQFLQQKV
jgi:3-dehydroquinate synthase